MDEYIGQSNLVEKMRLSIQAAKGRDEPHEHILYYGPPGLGKTTLAYILAKEMGANIVYIDNNVDFKTSVTFLGQAYRCDVITND